MFDINFLLDHYALWGVFFIIFCETAGAPFPGETLLITASVLSTLGKLPIMGIFVIGIIAATLGNLTGYLIGMYTGKSIIIKWGKWLYIKPVYVEKGEALLQKYGFLFVLIARFIPGARQVSGIIAGAGAMHFYTFLIANFLGAILWVGCWSFGPWLMHYLFVKTL